MSGFIAAPEFIAAVATDLRNIGSTLNAANSAAATWTTGVLPAAEDEVSAVVAALLSDQGQDFQALSAQVAAFHSQFVQALNSAGTAYTAAEAAGASPLAAMLEGAQSLVSSPTATAMGHPPIGNGADAAAKTSAGGSATATRKHVDRGDAGARLRAKPGCDFAQRFSQWG